MDQKTLEQTVQRLADVEEIKRLKYRYAEICDDDHNPDRVVELFTEDGIWESGEAFGTGRGRKGIHELFSKFAKMMDFTQHNMFNPIIDVDGDKATGTWYLHGTFRLRGGEDRILAGSYLDDYEKVNGKWLYKHLRWNPRVWVPRSVGWVGELVILK